MFFQLPYEAVAIRQRYQHAAAGNQPIGIDLEKLTDFDGFLAHGYILQINREANARTLGQFPQRPKNPSFRHIMHGAGAGFRRHCRLWQH